jgi:YggT family protein
VQFTSFTLNVWNILCNLLGLYNLILFARLIWSWFPPPTGGLRPIYNILHRLTEPALRLVRPLIPPIRTGAMAFDLSPIIIFVLIIILQGIVCGKAV